MVTRPGFSPQTLSVLAATAGTGLAGTGLAARPEARAAWSGPVVVPQ